VLRERRRLVATAREIEDRAGRVGRGRLYATFQSLAAFEDQLPRYRDLAAATDLRVGVVVEPDWEPPAVEGITVHRDEAGALAAVWAVAFDGAGDDDAKCALVATETESGAYDGVLTYDPAVVDDLAAHLDDVIG
jgi:DICT domain-containing protein